MQNRKSGFSLAGVVIFLAIIFILGLLGWVLFTKYIQKNPGNDQANQESSNWSFDGSKWQSSTTPPTCPDPLQLTSPVDISMASAVLYPGQTRGGDYKPHGGFRFDGKENDAIKVKAPMDAALISGSRYIEQGETQYMLFFVNSCGIAYRFDHLLTLSTAMQSAADTLPAPKENDSRSTPFNSPVQVKADEEIVTSVGFKNTKNVSVDFGVYDLRSQNAISKDSTFTTQHANEAEQAFYGVCWFDLLGSDAATVKSLPPADQASGKTSDYCK